MIDGLRGWGALLVLVGHSATFLGGESPKAGTIFVDLFFMISGFVIAYACEPKFASGLKAYQFIIFRTIRLYPLYLLGILLGFVVAVVASLDDIDSVGSLMEVGRQFGWSLFMLPTPMTEPPGGLYPLNGPAWSLFFELVVNIFYALTWRWLTTRVVIGIIIISAIALGLSSAMLGGVFAGVYWEGWWGGFARSFFGFFAGVLIFRAAGAPTEPGTRRSYGVVFLFLLLPAILMIRVPPQWFVYYQLFLLLALGMPLLQLAQAFQAPRLLERLFVFGGQISYALYVIHQPFLDAMIRLSWKWPELTRAPWAGLIFCATMIVLAYFAERWFDRPMRRWIVGLIVGGKKGRASRGRAAAAA
jgi:peptidoglycan/LPS O-acetylase OafA/YrhL